MKITNRSGTFTGKRYSIIIRSTHGNIMCSVDGKIQRWTSSDDGLVTDRESLDYFVDLARVVERYLFTPSMIEEGEADILAVTQLLKDGTIGWPEDGFAWDDDVLVQNKKENQR